MSKELTTNELCWSGVKCGNANCLTCQDVAFYGVRRFLTPAEQEKYLEASDEQTSNS